MFGAYINRARGGNMNCKKLDKQLNERCGLALQYLEALGVDVEQLVEDAVEVHLNQEYSRHVFAGEKRHGLPTRMILSKKKNADGVAEMYWRRSEKVLDANLKTLAARA